MPKLNWTCNKGETCFLEKAHPKIEMFDDCFPGNIGFGDLDGIVEVGGKLLILEWKRFKWDPQRQLGQSIMYERVTGDGRITVLIVVGDPERMLTTDYSIYFMGKLHVVGEATLSDVKLRVRKWAEWANANS